MALKSGVLTAMVMTTLLLMRLMKRKCSTVVTVSVAVNKEAGWLNVNYWLVKNDRSLKVRQVVGV